MSEIRSQEDLRTALAEVERDQDGIVVLSRFGFTIKELDGKKYVVALTEDEARSSVSNIETMGSIGECFTPYGGGYCVRHTCTRHCALVYTGSGWTCVCSY